MSGADTTLADIAKEVRRLAALLEHRIQPSDALIVSRRDAARLINVSERQLRKLVAAGRILAMPSGITRAELERYAKTPQTPLPKMMTRPMRERSAQEEAERGREMLKLLHKKRGA